MVMMMPMINTEQKRLLRNHANRNITFLLQRLGVPHNTRGDGLIQASCACKQHGGDRSNSMAWSWRVDLGKWVCWSHHCEDLHGNDIFGLVGSILHVDFVETVNWIIAALKTKNVNLKEEAADPDNLHRGTSLHVHEILAEDNLKFLQPDPQYLLNRGFDIDVLRKYQVGLWIRPGTYMHDRVVFPIRDHDGHLIGYTGRTVHPPEYFERRGIMYSKWIHGRHYNHWPKRGDLFTSSILYNLYNAKKYIGQDRTMIIVEGPLDGMKLEEAGIHNWVASLGTNFCERHRTLLVKYNIGTLLNAYDADDPSKYKDNQSPGDKGWERMQRVVGDLFNLQRILLPPGHDCGDLDIQTIQNLFKYMNVKA